MTRPREEWRADVISRYKSLEQFSKEDARLQFLRILRSLPYGNSIFFPVKRIEDPIGLLPQKLILGINKRGVHFFRPVPKEYLHSAELRDIMQVRAYRPRPVPCTQQQLLKLPRQSCMHMAPCISFHPLLKDCLHVELRDIMQVSGICTPSVHR